MPADTDPAPKQAGLTDAQQRFIDAVNYDQLKHAVEDEGLELSDRQKAVWRVLAGRLGRPDPTAG